MNVPEVIECFSYALVDSVDKILSKRISVTNYIADTYSWIIFSNAFANWTQNANTKYVC